MYDQTIIVGNVGKNPEMRYIQSGKAVTEFSVAVSRGWGEKKDTIWFKVTTWEKLAEVCNEFVTKGMPVLCEGHVVAEAWMKKDGEPVSELKLTAHTVKFLGKGESKPEPQKDDFPF